MVSQTHDILAAGYSWQASQMQSKAVMLLLKSAFTVVQWLLQKWNVLLSACHCNRSGFPFTHQSKQEKHFGRNNSNSEILWKHLCMCKFSWGMWDAPELWTSILKLTFRTNAHHYQRMLKIQSSPFCPRYTSTSPTLATRCPDTPHIYAAPLQYDSGDQSSLQWRRSHCDCGIFLCVSHLADLQRPLTL